MRALHVIVGGRGLVSHMRGLPPVGRVPFHHPASVLHANDVYVFVVGAIRVDGCEGLGDGVGRRLDFTDWIPAGYISLSVFSARVYIGSVRTVVGVLGALRWGEDVFRGVAGGAMLVVRMRVSGAWVLTQVALILYGDWDALLVAHTWTPGTAWVFAIFII